MVRLHVREHEMGKYPRMRIWVDGWSHDQFEIISYQLFEQLRKLSFFQIIEHDCQTSPCDCENN